ncbi:hypothetical protein LENED_002202 [Lentinula edodes]|uniref:Uncharacterized protein n=1 Tax=Lentinula edodes TaxID=5353 RepID=A0A1Q3E0I1_LENED|nr:hypothetical protein LENED_002202 [Lentinula edodes]
MFIHDYRIMKKGRFDYRWELLMDEFQAERLLSQPISGSEEFNFPVKSQTMGLLLMQSSSFLQDSPSPQHHFEVLDSMPVECYQGA